MAKATASSKASRESVGKRRRRSLSWPTPSRWGCTRGSTAEGRAPPSQRHVSRRAPLGLCGPQIVHHDDVARAEVRDELLLDVGQKDITVGGRVDRHKAAPAIESESSNHRHRAPVSVRRFPRRFLTDRCPAVVRRRPQSEAGLVEKDQPRRVELVLLGDEGRPLRLDVPAVLFAGDHCFFL